MYFSWCQFGSYLREFRHSLNGGGLYLFFISKFSSVDKSKYGVAVEGQGRNWKCDGSSPGHAHFEKVIFKIRLNFV